MAKQSEISVAKFESIGNKLFQVDLFTVKETDEAKIKYDDFLKFVVLKIFQVLRIFFYFRHQFLSPHLHRNSKYQDLWEKFIFIFMMSHG